MQTSSLGRTGVTVSRVALGTMVFGQQTSEDEARAMMDYALDQGVTLFDTAELYAIPPKPETAGETERILGRWFQSTGKRDKVILASKVMGRDEERTWLRDPPQTVRLTREQIDFAVEGSLRRLQTDHIDLYQLHYPDRQHRALGFNRHARVNDDYIAFEDQLESLNRHIEKGHILHWGLSNETPWGVMRFVAEADKRGWPRPASIQNKYSLLNRDFEYSHVETALREDIGLLAYSPMAQGALTGKYLHGVQPAGARHTCFHMSGENFRPGQQEAVQAYVDLAESRGLKPEHLALKFIATRPFVTSVLVGATSLAQLKSNLAAFAIDWPDDLDKAVHSIFQLHRTVSVPDYGAME